MIICGIISFLVGVFFGIALICVVAIGKDGD